MGEVIQLAQSFRMMKTEELVRRWNAYDVRASDPDEMSAVMAELSRRGYLQEHHARQLRELRAMPVDRLKQLWDAWDGSGTVEGYDGEDIHRVLNEKGEGRYCAV